MARQGIGALSKRTGCNIETIRFYERIGLLLPPPRTEGGHRFYAEEHVNRLTFVLRARELGFSIEELRSLLSLVDGGNYTCGEVRDLTLIHLADVRAKIADLRRLGRTLADISSRCEGGSVPDCPVIEALYTMRSPAVKGVDVAR